LDRGFKRQEIMANSNNKKGNRKRKIITTVIILLFLFINLTHTAVSREHEAVRMAGGVLGKLEKSKLGSFFLKLFTKENFEFAQRVYFSLFVWYGTNNIAEDINKHFVDYILKNPNIHTSVTYNLIRYFVSILYPLYILAIIVTGLYILFMPASPLGRARAKSLFGKLIISMVLVSMSPYLMITLLTFTQQITKEILGDPESPRGYVKIATEEFTSALYKMRNIIILGNTPNLILGGGAFLETSPFHELEKFGEWFHHNEWVEIETVWTAPPLLFIVLLIIGIYGLIAFRYFMLILWAILLPFTIFFSSFEFTKGIGRTMLEQTLLWSFLQVFYAIIIIVFAIGITVAPQDIYNNYGIGLNLNVIENYFGHSIGGGISGGENPFFISIFTFGGVFLLFLGPIIMFTFFQKLLPP